MNVALVHSNPLPPAEGIGNHVVNLAKQLRKNGHDVHLFTRGGWTSTETTIEGFPTHKPACPPIYPVHAHIHQIPLQRSLSEYGPFDIVHLHSPLVPFPDIDYPIVTTIHTPIRDDVASVPNDAPGQLLYRLQVPFSENLEQELVQSSDAVTCVSRSIKNLVQRNHSRPIDVVHNGVDVSEFDYSLKGRENNTLLYVGRLGPRKGIPRLLTVARYLRDREVDFTLRIVGKGQLEPEIRKTIDNYELHDCVEFLGFVDRDELLQLFQQTAIYIHLPEFEGLPTTVLEAMASGAPVIATDVPGCRDVIEHGENGVLVRRNDQAHIADQVSELLRDDERRKEYGKNARDTVEGDFDWTQIGEDYESIYKEVA